MVTGDLEAQHQHHPDWYLKHKHWLRANQAEETNKLGYFIRKVPEYLRQPSSDFTPLGWRFGLHNRENLDTTGPEAVKLSVAVEFGLVGEAWEAFCDAVVEDPESMLTCYGVTSWKHEEIKHVLALDALFLAVYCDLHCPQNERRLRTPTVMSSRYGEWCGIESNDLCGAENQIPFVLIQKAIEYLDSSESTASEASEDTCRRIHDIKYPEKFLYYTLCVGTDVFMTISGESFKTDNASPLQNRQHFLGAAYEVICGHEGLLRKMDFESQYIHIPSATELEISAIRIIGVNGPLCTMAYRNKCLFLPKMSIYDDTASFVRNMAWYERTTFKLRCMFHDYVLLMLDLIESPADLKVLSNCGVIHNGCGINAFEKWKALKEGLVHVPSSKEHHVMKLAIKKRCAFRRYRFWSEFRILFCSRPWLALSTCAVLLVTVATLIQTYVAVIGSNRMKPKFP